MLFFKKSIIIVSLFFVTTALVSAQSFIPKAPYIPITGGVKEAKRKGSESTKSTKSYRVMPFVCYDNFLFADTGGLGCDFKYTTPSGIALYGNAGLIFGKTEKYIWRTPFTPSHYEPSFAFLFSLEALLAYSKTFANRHTIAFGIGLQGAYGVGLMEFIALAFRLEYSYLITKRYGIHFSFTDGVGVGTNGALAFINRASLRVGPIIYF